MSKNMTKGVSGPDKTPPLNEYGANGSEPVLLVDACYGVARMAGGFVAVKIDNDGIKVLSEAPERFLDAKKVALTELAHVDAVL